MRGERERMPSQAETIRGVLCGAGMLIIMQGMIMVHASTCDLPPMIDGVYSASGAGSIDFSECARNAFTQNGRLVTIGHLTGGSFENEAFMAAPGEYETQFTLKTSPENPLFVENQTVHRCKYTDESCVDGSSYVNDGKARVCVWTKQPQCSWRLECAGNDDVKRNFIHILQERDGRPELLVVNTLETGFPMILPDGTVNPYQSTSVWYGDRSRHTHMINASHDMHTYICATCELIKSALFS